MTNPRSNKPYTRCHSAQDHKLGQHIVEVSLRRADQSSRGVLPTVMRRCVWSRNLVNEEAMARVWPQHHRKKKMGGCDHDNFKILIYWGNNDKRHPWCELNRVQKRTNLHSKFGSREESLSTAPPTTMTGTRNKQSSPASSSGSFAQNVRNSSAYNWHV